ncbi:MAG TPA: trigger factor [Actinotalea caeni]|uniref:trigger factor n=1 Tax=Actinotalea caeni TaxID=1348467 RepID=UPI0012E23707|nr:trigger factor [Actinotalea caeni]HLV54571.1 trigger factor [Actinotalea caeni]
MKSAVETVDETRVKLTVEVPMVELQPNVDKAYKEIAQQVTIPGFRKGKVPPRIIDQRVGKPVVLEQAINEAMPELYRRAVTEADIKPIGQPKIDVTTIPGLTGEDDGDDLVFTAELDVRPEIELPDLSGVTLTVDSVEVTDEDVEESLTTLRQRYASLVGVDRPVADGDFLSIDLRAAIGDEEIDTASGVSYQVGSGNLLPGIDEAVIGLSAGETATFSAPLAGGEHAGEEAQVTVTVVSVKEQELPEVDDDFAQMASEVDTIDELRENLRTQVADAKVNNQAVQARDRLLEHLLENTEFPLPQGVIEDEIHRHLEGEGRLDDDEHREEVREQATDALRRQLLLDALAEKVKVQVEQGEMVEFMLRTAQQYRMDPNEFIQSAAANNQMPLYMAELARNKSLAVALRDVTVVDEAGNAVDLTEFIGDEDEDAAATTTETVEVEADEPEADEAAEAEDGDTQQS